MEVNVRTLLSLFTAPEEHSFHIISDGVEPAKKYGLLIQKGQEKIQSWRPFATSVSEVKDFLSQVLELAEQYGEMTYFTPNSFMAETFVGGCGCCLSRGQVLNEHLRGVMVNSSFRSVWVGEIN